jgi:integrase
VSTCANVAAHTFSNLDKRLAYKRLAPRGSPLDQDWSGATANEVCDRDTDYYDSDGRRHRQKAAPSYEVAKLVLRDKLNSMAKGEVLGVREEGMSVKAFIDTVYWPVVKPTLQVDWATRSRDILDRITESFGSRPLSKLTADEIAVWYGKRLGAVTVTTANKELSRLRHLFARAVDWRYVKASPAATVKRLKDAPGRVRYLTEAEREALLAGANDRLKRWIEVALQTGARRAELHRLRWSDLDLAAKMITFRGTKNGTDRRAPMTDELHALLAGLPRSASGPVLPVYRDPHVLTRSFSRLVERLGLKDLTFHDLRHDVASTLTMAGVSQRAVMEVLGHRDPRMTIRYQHLEPGHLREAMRSLSR